MITNMAPQTQENVVSTVFVPKRVEEALFYRLKQKAFKECDDTAKAYADCCRGRSVSLAWACREESRALNICMAQYTSSLGRLKERWAAQGFSPGHVITKDEWDRLLHNLVLDNK